MTSVVIRCVFLNSWNKGTGGTHRINPCCVTKHGIFLDLLLTFVEGFDSIGNKMIFLAQNNHHFW